LCRHSFSAVRSKRITSPRHCVVDPRPGVVQILLWSCGGTAILRIDDNIVITSINVFLRFHCVVVSQNTHRPKHNSAYQYRPILYILFYQLLLAERVLLVISITYFIIVVPVLLVFKSIFYYDIYVYVA